VLRRPIEPVPRTRTPLDAVGISLSCQKRKPQSHRLRRHGYQVKSPGRRSRGAADQAHRFCCASQGDRQPCRNRRIVDVQRLFKMSELGDSRRFDSLPATSGLPPTSDVNRQAPLVRLVPEAAVSNRSIRPLPRARPSTSSRAAGSR
jgi:hypothetical protein